MLLPSRRRFPAFSQPFHTDQVIPRLLLADPLASLLTDATIFRSFLLFVCSDAYPVRLWSSRPGVAWSLEALPPCAKNSREAFVIAIRLATPCTTPFHRSGLFSVHLGPASLRLFTLRYLTQTPQLLTKAHCSAGQPLQSWIVSSSGRKASSFLGSRLIANLRSHSLPDQPKSSRPLLSYTLTPYLRWSARGLIPVVASAIPCLPTSLVPFNI